MTLIRFAVLLVLLAVGCGFVKNCQNFNPTNFALCSLCLPDFYLGNGKCYPCPANRSTIRECSVAVASPQAATVANGTNLTQGAQVDSSNGSNSSASSQQSKKQENSTVTGAIVLTNKNGTNNNASSDDSKGLNNNNTTALNTTNATSTSAQTNSTPSNNTAPNNSTPSNSMQNSTPTNSNQRVDFTQMIFNYLPAHCSEFKLVPVLACSACKENYVLINDNCILAPPPPAENTTSQNQTAKNITASVIPAGLKVTSSLTTSGNSTASNAFIPIASPPPATNLNFFIPVAPQFLPATTAPTTTTPSNTTVVMPQKEPISDFNCLTRNPQFSLSKPVSADNQRCSICYSGFFYSLAKEQCLPLNPLCKTSDTQNRCLTCYMGYIPSKGNCILDNGQNVTQVTPSSSTVKIQQIDPNCQKYQENSSVCAVCANRYYFSVSRGLCLQVDTSCKTWDTIKGYCLTCYTGYTCGANEYICKPIVVPTSTSPSDPNSFKKYCLRTRNNICVSCAFRSFLSNGLCLPVSDLCQTFNPNFGYCLSCYPGYTLENRICQQDQLLNPDPNCASYNYNTNTCSQCNYNYFPNNGWCQMVSPFCNGYDPNSGFCLDCISIYNLDPQTGICS